ncbi:FAD-dependent thymidylate synthase [Syntrophotalea acetylenica]|uniref:FAD-dependent thymidylate synthase n=1 Tax=Syntrophotalea acetylenica TaxID=29542 RepID=A0A1L3GDQ7_SYNAC|nr:FAD-dependent thymidylate synthase [Syntrophotalea acetylenica]APG24083.1 thymidylate synthase, flavin-dependent [Syntrophotalea acetylenica]APG44665.1 hypothetical protein A6070_11470 [Syntrophotalea acetylenica]
MILVTPSVEVLHITERPLHLIEAAGRTCYKSQAHPITITTAGQFAQMLVRRGHESVLEHAHATLRIVCDRGVSHEIVRHRLASYSQESTRYCDYTRGHVTFIIPPWVDVDPDVVDMTVPDADAGLALLAQQPQDYGWLLACSYAEQTYRSLRQDGWTPEQARTVLPNSLKTEIVMTANLRQWRHFFTLRTAPAAHPQMRELADLALAALREQIPVVFDDIEAGHGSR